MIIDDVNLDILSGEKIGIIGQSGIGKTTLVQLLIRSLQPTSGEILLNNRNLNSIHQDSLYSNIGILPQEPVLFNRTIFENIAYGSTLDLKFLNTVLHLTYCNDFIQEFPLGLHTVIGSDGVFLSIGQKQRIMIARLLMKNPNVMIFDECTSGIDHKTSVAIINNLLEYCNDKSIIFITHQVKSLSKIDKIYLIENNTLAPYDLNQSFQGIT